ncbi:unnamed protein product, partial [Meganyctiphanes norvegica]
TTITTIRKAEKPGRILIMHPMHAASHVFALRTLSLKLVERGHKVDVVRWQDNHFYPPMNHPSITEHVMAINNSMGTVPYVTHEERGKFMVPSEDLWKSGLEWVHIPLDIFYTVSAFCDALLGNEPLIHYLKAQKFDVAIVDLIYNSCSLALVNKLGIPPVGYWAMSFIGGDITDAQGWINPNIVPIMYTSFPTPMTFLQRVKNNLMVLGMELYMTTQYMVTSMKIQRYLPGSPSPSTMMGNLTGLLINSHPALDIPTLLPPSFLQVGGFHIKETKPLPMDIEHFLLSSGSEGTIFFSMGSIFNNKAVPESAIMAFMSAFGRLKQKVLCVFSSPLSWVPPNVKVVNWVPQQDVLAHNQTVLFLTHCGMHSIIESVYHSVPMVGMPIFIDQGDNMQRMVERNIAASIKKMATADEIYDTIMQVLSNEKYKKSVETYSKVLRHHSTPPLDRAVWLLEHIMVTKGAAHLKIPANDLNTLQYFSVDVILFIFMVTLCLAYVLYRMLRRISSRFRDELQSELKLK